jgi:hypothetical protein
MPQLTDDHSLEKFGEATAVVFIGMRENED